MHLSRLLVLAIIVILQGCAQEPVSTLERYEIIGHAMGYNRATFFIGDKDGKVAGLFRGGEWDTVLGVSYYADYDQHDAILAEIFRLPKRTKINLRGFGPNAGKTVMRLADELKKLHPVNSLATYDYERSFADRELIKEIFPNSGR